jgi:hypothetical protein
LAQSRNFPEVTHRQLAGRADAQHGYRAPDLILSAQGRLIAFSLQSVSLALCNANLLLLRDARYACLWLEQGRPSADPRIDRIVMASPDGPRLRAVPAGGNLIPPSRTSRA